MADFNLIIGERFNKLTVVEFMGRKNLHTWYKCECECGGTSVTTLNNLRRNHTQSCGCLQKERTSKATIKHGAANKVPEYRAWKGMNQRCYNGNDKRFSDWGGRNISVCDRWRHSFENFISDMGVRPSNKHSLDRFPNINGNYEPSNCRWATIYEQTRGKRNNRWYEYNGKRMILSDWAKYFKVSHSTLSEHLEKKLFKDVYLFYKNKSLEL